MTKVKDRLARNSDPKTVAYRLKAGLPRPRSIDVEGIPFAMNLRLLNSAEEDAAEARAYAHVDQMEGVPDEEKEYMLASRSVLEHLAVAVVEDDESAAFSDVAEMQASLIDVQVGNLIVAYSALRVESRILGDVDDAVLEFIKKKE